MHAAPDNSEALRAGLDAMHKRNGRGGLAGDGDKARRKRKAREAKARAAAQQEAAASAAPAAIE